MKRQKRAMTLRGRMIAALFLAVALALLGAIGYAAVLARIVHVERVTVYSPDLPRAFDGVKVLFVSDIDMTGFTTPRGVARLFERLERLEPDMLVLGGDYACDSLLEEINGTGSETELSKQRRALFALLKDFSAPLGKFAVAGENDAFALNLEAELSLGDIALLSDSGEWVEKDGARMAVVGLKDYDTGATDYGAVAARVARSDFILVAAHNPSAVGGVVTAEAGDSGAWCDLMLTGHNHGGQAVLFGRTMLRLTQEELRRLSGWFLESGVRVLVSEGLGCESVNFRLGTRAEVHLITLRCAPEQ